MATSHSTSELQVHLTKRAETMARRMLTIIHNSFSCLSPLWISSRRDVWFGLVSTHLEAIDTWEWSGTVWQHVDCYSLQHRGLFAFSFLLSYTCNKCIIVVFKDASVRYMIFAGSDTRQGMLRMFYVDVLWDLFWRKNLHHMWASCPNQHFFQILLTLREHLIYIYNECLWLYLSLFSFSTWMLHAWANWRATRER